MPRTYQSPDKRRKSPVWARITLVLGAVLVAVSGGAIAFVQVAESKVNAAIPDHQLAGGAAQVKHADIKGAKNFVDEALVELKAGKPVSSPATRAYGCAVKYSS